MTAFAPFNSLPARLLCFLTLLTMAILPSGCSQPVEVGGNAPAEATDEAPPLAPAPQESLPQDDTDDADGAEEEVVDPPAPDSPDSNESLFEEPEQGSSSAAATPDVDLDEFLSGEQAETPDDRYAADTPPPALASNRDEPTLWRKESSGASSQKANEDVSEFFGDMMDPADAAAEPPTDELPLPEAADEAETPDDPLSEFLGDPNADDPPASAPPASDDPPAADSPPATEPPADESPLFGPADEPVADGLPPIDLAPLPTGEPPLAPPQGAADIEPPDWLPSRPATSTPEEPPAEEPLFDETDEPDPGEPDSGEPNSNEPGAVAPPQLPANTEPALSQPAAEPFELPVPELESDDPPTSPPTATPPPALRQPPKRPTLDIHNTRQLAWLLGSKLGLMTADRVESPTWETDAVAEMLGVEPVRLAPGGADQQAAARLLKSAGQLGAQLARTHGHDHAALLEIAVKSNAVAALYQEHPKLAGPVAAALQQAAARSELDPELVAPLLETLRAEPTPEQLREAVFQLHERIGAELESGG